MIAIGIDTGVNTGVAVWDTTRRCFRALGSFPIHRALEIVLSWRAAALMHSEPVVVFIEDARKRTWIPREGSFKAVKGRAMGAGSVKRDSKIWDDFLKDKQIPYRLVAPKDNATKLSAEAFAKIVGFDGRTNEHARDAAMLVWNKSDVYYKSALQ